MTIDRLHDADIWTGASASPGRLGPPDAARWALHRADVEAAMRRSRGGTIVGHRSAAAVHGLPMLGMPPDRVEAVVPRVSGGRVTRSMHVRPSTVRCDEVVELDGMRVTSVARTLLDLGACRGYCSAGVSAGVPAGVVAVVAADAAVHRGLVTPEQWRATLRAHPTMHGRIEASEVLRAADGRAAGPAESLSRLILRRAGTVPPPVLGVPARGFHDHVLGRLAFYWERSRVAAVVDETPEDLDDPDRAAFVEELRDLEAAVLRWGWQELAHPRRLVRKVRDVVDLRIPDPTPW